MGDQRKRVAIIGGGIAGLSCAHRLSQKYQVTLFERSERPGFDAGSHEVLDGETRHHIDVPLRVFSRSYYPHLATLYESVGIAVTRQEYGTSFTLWGEASAGNAGDGQSAYFQYEGAASSLVPFLRQTIPWLSSPALWPWLGQCLRFFHLCQPTSDSAPLTKTETLSEWLDRLDPPLTPSFVSGVLLPMLSGVLTCSYDAVMRYPARIILDYLHTSRLRDVHRVENGTDHVVRVLTKNTHRIACGTTVLACYPANHAQVISDPSLGELRPPENMATLVYKDNKLPPESSSVVEYFDHIIIAAPPTLALRFLQTSSQKLQRALSAFKAETSRVLLHRDPALMPQHQSSWAPINVLVSRQDARPMVTVWMNSAQKGLDLKHPLYQTWNPLVEPSKDHFLAESVFERPIITPESVDAIDTLWREQGNGNIWFCGSYALYGMPLLENAVHSALKVSNLLGAPADPSLEPAPEKTDNRLYSISFISIFALGAALFLSSASR